jgi:hypothetical protein
MASGGTQLAFSVQAAAATAAAPLAAIAAHSLRAVVRPAHITYPTGSKSFSVLQAFPAAFSAEEADPFLMCDAFGPVASRGVETDVDKCACPSRRAPLARAPAHARRVQTPASALTPYAPLPQSLSAGTRTAARIF